MPVLTCTKCGTILVVAKSDYAKLSAKPYICNACKMGKKQGYIGKITEEVGIVHATVEKQPIFAPPGMVVRQPIFAAPDGVKEVRKYGKRKGFGRD